MIVTALVVVGILWFLLANRQRKKDIFHGKRD